MASDKFVKKMQKLYEEAGKQFSEFAKIPEGTSTWRLLPYKKDDDGDPVFFLRSVTHFLGDEGNEACPQEHAGEKCPFCNFFQKHREDENIKLRSLAQRFRPQTRYLANAVSIDEKGRAAKEVVKLQMPRTVYSEILKFFGKRGWEDMLDPIKGNNLGIDRVQKSKSRMNVEYGVSPEKESTPIAKTKEAREALRKQVVNLDKLVKLKTYDELKEKLIAVKKNRKYVEESIEQQRAFEKTKR